MPYVRYLFYVGHVTHFSHPSILIHCHRPWLQEGDVDGKGWWASDEIKERRTNEMDAALVDNWNDVVGRKDMVYILGDFAWKNHSRFIQAVNGKKILILGNHDKMSQDVYSSFTEVYAGIKDINVKGQGVALCHYPMYSWRGSNRGGWHFHGHTHNSPFRHPGMALNVGTDVHGYRPVSWEELAEECVTKKIEQLSDKDADNYRTPVKVAYQQIVSATTKAWYIETGFCGKKWFPKSPCVLDEENKIIKIPKWLKERMEL